MSTYLYLECLDHTPPLMSDEESGQHLPDLITIRADIRDREVLVRLWDEGHVFGGMYGGQHMRFNTAKFLAAHRTCRIGIRDEYGVEHPVKEADGAPSPVSSVRSDEG